MQEDDLAVLISKTAALMEQFERRCTAIDRRLLDTSKALQELTQDLPTVFRQAADGSLQTLPGQVLKRVQDGLAQPVADYQKRLDQAGRDVGSVSHALALQIKRMDSLQQLLLWKVVGVTATCLVLLLAGGIWLSMHYTKVIEDNQITADLMRAFNRADVVLCEKNQLCANVDTKGKRYGDHKQYFPVIGR